jgi:hypothetical protein
MKSEASGCSRWPTVAPFNPSQIGTLLRGDPQTVSGWTERIEPKRLALHLVLIILGAGSYGAAMGWWRAPEQALFTAIKFPIIILLTTLGTALLNAMLAPLLGLNIPFRQSFVTILMSFASACVILGAFSPLTAFLIWNAPPIADAQRQTGTYNFILLTHVLVIAFSGIVANVRLRRCLIALGGRSVANRVLFSWLAVNLFFGSQLSWIFRPFIGSPGLQLQFLRDHPLAGNFYEAVYHSLMQLLKSS